jgi:UDP-glucose 4-epimerase
VSVPKNPLNPYGESKLQIERILAWHQKINGIRYAVLRYFNAADAWAAMANIMNPNRI